jgi:septal ring factor EnvC (AmiA/AmiB activator)
MVAARWRLNRIATVESETIDLRQARMDHSGELKKEFDVILEPTRLAIAFEKEMNESKTLDNLSRFEARYDRKLSRAIAQLRQVQKDRRAAEAAEAREAAEEAITCEQEPICKNEGNATPKAAPKPLEIVRPAPGILPEPVSQPSNPAPEDHPRRS